MLKISSATAPVAAVAVAFVAVIGASAPVNAADCLGGPNAPSPHGQHWYYRIDRSTGRKCWYLRGFLSHREARPAHLATAQSPIAAPPPTPAPRPLRGAAQTAAHGEVKILTVSPVQFANPPAVQALQQRPQQQRTPQPAAAVPALQASTAGQNDPPRPVRAAAAVDPAAGADPPRAGSGSPNAEAANATAAVAAIGSTEMFFLLVLGIGLATFVLGVVIKTIGGARALPIDEDPDSAWRRYRLDHRPPGRDGADVSPARRRAATPGNKPALTLTAPFASSFKELEPALRALGEARRDEAPAYRNGVAAMLR